MTTLLDRAIKATQSLPSEMQDEIAWLMLAYVGEGGSVIRLSPDEEADLAEADAEIARGEFATDEEVAATFARYRL